MKDFLRQSQVLTTFGPGAMVDLPDRAVLIEGLQSWRFGDRREEIHEPRLQAKLRQKLDLPEVRLVKPPAFDERPTAKKATVGARIFPTWFLLQQARGTGPNGQWRRRRLVRWDELTNGRFRDDEDRSRRPKKVVPVRFVCGCPRGHLDDLDWRVFAHRSSGPSCGRRMWLKELGMGEHLVEAVEAARLCSNDPVCAEHDPSAEHDPLRLHGAACHGCLLIAETSCEQRNDWLDRALVVPSLRALPNRTLRDLAGALKSRRIQSSASAYQVRHAVPAATEAAAEELAELLRAGLIPQHAGTLLEAIMAERAKADASPVELVTSGPDAVSVTRDTGVILRDLFARAESRVLVVGFAILQGRRVFATLAERMVEREALAVRLCVDIARSPGDTSREDGILARFRGRLVHREWPGPRLPEVFYDPRALAQGDSARASLHAKCVVIDGRIAFVGSANLTEAAQQRNIEVGLIVRTRGVADALEAHFDALIRHGFLKALFPR